MLEEDKLRIKKLSRSCSYVNPLIWKFLEEYENTMACFELASTLKGRRFNCEFVCQNGDYEELISNIKMCGYADLDINDKIQLFLFDSMIMEWTQIV